MISTFNVLAICRFLILFSRFAASEEQQAAFVSTERATFNPHTIAIIGAGAAGSSAAYYLSAFSQSLEANVPVNITVFEANNRIGGRTTTVNALDDPRYPTELGASIFVEVNQILYNATRDFGLNYKEKLYESTGSNFDLGIWDGNSFVFTISGGTDDSGLNGRWKGWWDIAKLLWKYGLSPVRTQRLAKTAVGRFLKLYDEYFPFEDLTTVSDEAGLLEFTGITGEEALTRGGVSEQFSREIVQSSTRVNYAQNLGTIHGLESLVCMSINGATAVEGGNWQIFSNMVQKSGAKLHLNTTVSMITAKSSGKSVIVTVKDEQKSSEEFDTVILAAPLDESEIKFSPPLFSVPSKVDYVELYVTLFSTPYRPAPSYFGLSSQNDVPDSILTTLPEGTDLKKNRGIKAVGPAEFWSLSTLRVLDPANDGVVGAQASSGQINPATLRLGKQYLYKIFSPKPVSAQWLNNVFGWNYTIPNGTAAAIETLPKELVTWHHEKTWHSYPYLPPRTQFGEFQLWPRTDGDIAVTGLQPSLWYTSVIEPFISTMETSALSGMNVARLIVDRLRQK